MDQKLDYLVCTCMAMMAPEIGHAITDGANDFKVFLELLMVGSACSSCVDEVQEMLKKTSK